MNLIISAKNRARRGVTLLEMIFVAVITLMVAIPVLATLLFVLRTQATAADITLTRLGAERVIAQVRMDIRNSSSGAYNTPGWPRLFENAQRIEWTVLDTVMGQRIRWQFNKETRQLTRNVGTVVNGDMANEVTTYPTRFVDLAVAEVTYTEFASSVNADGQVEIEDESSSLNQITAIRITGRVFHRLPPNLTVWNEVDGNGDGTFVNDRIGADLFGRDFAGDDPKWQYLFNSQIGFRNS